MVKKYQFQWILFEMSWMIEWLFCPLFLSKGVKRCQKMPKEEKKENSKRHWSLKGRTWDVFWPNSLTIPQLYLKIERWLIDFVKQCNQNWSKTMARLKFRYSEKATQFWRNLPISFDVSYQVHKSRLIFSKFYSLL